MMRSPLAIRPLSFIVALVFASIGLLSINVPQSIAATAEPVALEQEALMSPVTQTESPVGQTMVTVLRTQRYVITIRGDNLTRLSGRFGVTRKMVLDSNPQIASRTNPERLHWLYLGEEVTIPVFITEIKQLHAVGAEELVAVPARVLTKHAATKEKLEAATAALVFAEAKNTELTNKNTDFTNKNTALATTVSEMEKTMSEFKKHTRLLFLLITIVAIFFLLILVLIAAITKKPNLPLTGNRKEPAPPKAPHTDESASLQSGTANRQTGEKSQMTATDVVTFLQNLTGAELKQLADTAIVVDEVGNPSTIKKVGDFMSKRADLELEKHPLSEWPKLLERKKCEDTQKTSAAA